MIKRSNTAFSMLGENTKLAELHFKLHFLQKKYSIGFYTGGGKIKNWDKLSEEEKKKKLSATWYIWWSYRHPKTGLLTRQTNVQLMINSHDTKEDRLSCMIKIKSRMQEMFKRGYSPYLPDEDVEQKKKEQKKKELKKATVEKAFKTALALKKADLKESSRKNYKSRLGMFGRYLKSKNIKFIQDVTKKHVYEYLKSIEGDVNSNNTKSVIDPVFSKLSSEGFIKYNFVKEIEKRKVRKKGKILIPEKHIYEALNVVRDNDVMLDMYIKLVSFTFWRPIEIVRLQIENVDFHNKKMVSDAKAKDGKTKIIPKIIYDDLQEYCKDRTGPVFKLNAKSDIDKRSYLTKRFKKLRTAHNLNKELTPYYFRKFRITQLYLEIRKTMSVEDSIKKLSLITGHTSKAIYSYILVNDVELPEDYSELFKQ